MHQTFDGVKLILDTGQWNVQAFATKAVQTSPGIFDDAPQPGRAFWGVYATHPFAWVPGGHLDVYYFGLEHSVAHFNQGTGRELRQSLGTRLWGKSGNGWDYDVEPIIQFGSFNESVPPGTQPIEGQILAWAAEGSTGYTLRSASWTPRLGMEADIDSGDKNPQNPNLQTFNPLFPRGLYNQLIVLAGHANFIDVQPSVTLHPTDRLTITPDLQFLWRESVNDGLYGVGGNLIRAAGTSQARYLGSQADFVANWHASRHFTFVAIYSHFLPGHSWSRAGLDAR